MLDSSVALDLAPGDWGALRRALGTVRIDVLDDRRRKFPKEVREALELVVSLGESCLEKAEGSLGEEAPPGGGAPAPARKPRSPALSVPEKAWRAAGAPPDRRAVLAAPVEVQGAAGLALAFEVEKAGGRLAARQLDEVLAGVCALTGVDPEEAATALLFHRDYLVVVVPAPPG